MGKIRWLHLSDIHMNKRGVDNERMRQKLLEYLKNNHMQFDYIFLTGDLRYAPEGAFHKDTAQYLKELCEVAGVERKNLFIVPGNHDIDRDHVVRKQAVENLFKNGYDSKNGVIKQPVLGDLKAGREAFIEVIKEIYDEDPDRIACYDTKKKLHFCIETEDFNVVHIDSTISYTKERQRDLILGTEEVMNVLKQVNTQKTTIILTHYSYDFLTRSEQNMMCNLLMDYNVQLWIAGHEHDDLLRKQRDYFYEFQCGNLIYEGADTKSCIAIGEMDAVNGKGSVTIHYWDSPNGWVLYPFASNQEDRSVYRFALNHHEAVETEVTAFVHSEEFKKISEHECVFNIHDLTADKVKMLEENGFLEVKKELGTRLKGDETDQEAIQMFLYEVNSAFHSNKRFECMPLFQNVVRDTFTAYIYLDAEIAPFMKATVVHFFYDVVDNFVIYNDTLCICIATIDHEISNIAFSYHFSKIDTAEERLYYLNLVRRYISSERVFIKMCNHEQYNLSFATALPCEEWEQNVRKTEYWIEQMQDIRKIEDFYHIKFKLPEKATEEEYQMIRILSASIDMESSRILPALPMEKVGFRRRFTLENDIFIDHGEYLPVLHLFGYAFKPVAQYIKHGNYYWNKKKAAWEAKTEDQEGIPVRVEFQIYTGENDD